MDTLLYSPRLRLLHVFNLGEYEARCPIEWAWVDCLPDVFSCMWQPRCIITSLVQTTANIDVHPWTVDQLPRLSGYAHLPGIQIVVSALHENAQWLDYLDVPTDMLTFNPQPWNPSVLRTSGAKVLGICKWKPAETRGCLLNRFIRFSNPVSPF